MRRGPSSSSSSSSSSAHHRGATVPLRKCTCSHFLLFVWGGLALGRYWAKLEHQSANEPRSEKTEGGKKEKETEPNVGTAVAHRDTVRLVFCRPPDRHAICRYVARVAMDGAAALERWTGWWWELGCSDGGWKAFFSYPSLLIISIAIVILARTRRMARG